MPYYLFVKLMRPSAARIANSAFSMLGATKEPSGLFAQRGTVPELNISGTQVLVTLMIALCLAVPLVWAFVNFAYSTP